MSDDNKRYIFIEVNKVLPLQPENDVSFIDMKEVSIRSSIIGFLSEKDDDPLFYTQRAKMLLNDFKTCLLTFSKEAQEEYMSRMKQWGIANIIPKMDIKEKLLSNNRSTQTVKIQKPSACAKCANKGKVLLRYYMKGLKNEEVVLNKTRIQLVPYKIKYFVQSSSGPFYQPPSMEIDIPLSEAEKKDYLITLDGKGEKELDWSDEKIGKYSNYRVVVLPVESSEVDNWLLAYQNIIDGLHQKLQENWTEQLLPEWEKFSALNINKQYDLLTKGWNAGLSAAVNDKVDEYQEAWKKFEEWDFRGWLNELFKERVISDEPTLTLLQDEVIFYISANYAQCWMAMLPPHYKIIFTGKMCTALMISMMEIIAELIIESLVSGGFIALLSNALKAVRWCTKLLSSMTLMASDLKIVMKGYVADSILLSRAAEQIKVLDGVSNVILELSSSLTPLIKIVENKINKIKSVISKTLNNDSILPKSPVSADPISMVTGEELLTLDDVEFKGLLPFLWQRCYRTSAVEHNIGLGYGWSHSLAHYLLFEKDNVTWLDNENLLTTFPIPTTKDPIIINPVAESTIYLGDKTDEYLLSKGNGARLYHFKRVGNSAFLVAISDKYSHRLNVIYDENQRVIALQPQEDKYRRLAFSYDSEESILIKTVVIQSLVVDEWQTLQTIVQYHYNDKQQLISATNAAGQTESYQYDDFNVIQQRIMAGGAEFNWTWDGKGKDVRCLHQWGNFGQLDETYKWQDEDVTVTMGDGSQKSYSHKDGLLLSEIDGNGATKTYQYNEIGLKTVEIDALGHETHYLYTQNAQLATIIYPDKQVEEFTWQRGRVIRIERNGQIWRLRYNSKDDIIEEESPDGLITQHSYNEHGQRISTQFPDGIKQYFEWGARGELLEERFSDGRVYQFHYDALLRLVKVSDEFQTLTRYTYDALGQIITVTHSDNSTREYQYNSYGKVTWFKDESGKVTEYEYASPLHLMTEKRLPNGDKLKFRYDNIHLQVSEIVNQKGEIYHLSYTPTGQLSGEIGFDGIKTLYQYDLNGQLIEKQEFGDKHDQAPLITHYHRNAMGKLIAKELPDGQKELYNYNADGLLTEIADGQSVLAWEYDEFGRLIAEHQNWATIRHCYDKTSGVLNGTRLPDGQWLEYHHRNGQLRGMTLDNMPLAGFKWNTSGREYERRQGNGLVNRYHYDNRSRLSEHQIFYGYDVDNEASPHVLWQQCYQYQLDGELSKISGQQSKTYHYDNIGQLTAVSHIDKHKDNHHAAPVEFFTYDKTGNQQEHQAHQNKANITQVNRLTFFGDRHFEYDRFGNLVTEKRGKNQQLVTHYEYDCRHRLIKVIKPNLDVITYRYDAFNRRISKTVDGKTTEFIWQGNKLISETDNAKHWQSYLYEPDSYRPLALVQGNAQQCKTKIYWYQNDQLGTPIRLTDEFGEKVYECQYNAYGQIIDETYNEEGCSTIPENPLRFQGQYYDEETDLHYNLNRYYDPKLGRYITQDPIGILGGLNPYKYCQNPVNWVDPLGLLAETGFESLTRMGMTDVLTLNSNEVRLSQNTVSYNKIDRFTLKKYTYDDIVASMKKDGWKGDFVDVIKMPDGKFTSMDNTRIVAAREAGIDIKAKIHDFNEKLTPEIQKARSWKQYETWGGGNSRAYK